MTACPAWIREQPIAHRGLHGPSGPENSIPAFEAAIAQEYAIELDIQRLADGKLAVFHDKDLMRLTGEAGLVFEQTANSIQQLTLLGTEHKVPLLEEVLTLIAGRVPVLVEIKNEGAVGPLEAELALVLSRYSGDCAIQAFNPKSLAWFKKHSPAIPRGQLASNFEGDALGWPKKLLLSNLLMNWASSPQFIAYDLKALPTLPVTINARLFQLPIVAWTVRTEADCNQAERYADNIIFEGVRP
ncbi:MAG: glycerophosphodiester phosphodiesterase family protein [Elainellaceae cyanobacterium]